MNMCLKGLSVNHANIYDCWRCFQTVIWGCIVLFQTGGKTLCATVLAYEWIVYSRKFYCWYAPTLNSELEYQHEERFHVIAFMARRFC